MKRYENHGDAVNTLIAKDQMLEVLFQEPPFIEIRLVDDYFLALLGAIVSQQLSGKVADVIYGRVLKLFDHLVTPKKVMEASFDDLRTAGLSGRKISYIQSLAQLVESGEVHFKDIETMSNEDIITMLTKIKGIGPWTAEMFLIFSLGREDVFSVLDLGLRTAVQKLYGKSMTHDEIISLSKKWEPYRSLVSLYLWRYNDRNR